MVRAWDAGKFIHIGRVNSQKRYRYFQGLAEQLDPFDRLRASIDIVSCDGTAARFHPSQALRRLGDVMYESSLAGG
jgi:hypothetical protein